MNQPPKMISTKDSGSFNDQLNSLYVLSKKLKAYEESVEDNDIKMTLGRVNSTIKNHYDRINDVLLCLKSLLSDYTTFIIECSHQQLANKLIDIQKEVYQIQREVFDLMYSKGWYPLEPETPQKIQKVVQEYTAKESHLM